MGKSWDEGSVALKYKFKIFIKINTYYPKMFCHMSCSKIYMEKNINIFSACLGNFYYNENPIITQ